MHYVVVVQIEPFGNYVLSFLPGTRDEDLRAALAKLPTAEDEYIFEFGTYHAEACDFADNTCPKTALTRLREGDGCHELPIL